MPDQSMQPIRRPNLTRPAIAHHVPDNLLAAYAAGSLDCAFSLVVASHVAICDECKASLSAHETLGGAVLEDLPCAEVSRDLRARVFENLDQRAENTPCYRRQGSLPAPVMRALKGEAPAWQSVGLGVRQCILHSDDSGTARLLHIPPGRAIPEHGHGGLELTLVLQGCFQDESGIYKAGDIEVADAAMNHTPVADHDYPCLCLAATDAPLRFKGLFPRLLQPIFRI